MQKYHTAFRRDCTLRQSMKFANRVFIIRWGFVFVYGQGWCFFGDLHWNLVFLVLAFKQKNRAPSQRRPYKNT